MVAQLRHEGTTENVIIQSKFQKSHESRFVRLKLRVLAVHDCVGVCCRDEMARILWCVEALMVCCVEVLKVMR